MQQSYVYQDVSHQMGDINTPCGRLLDCTLTMLLTWMGMLWEYEEATLLLQ